MFDEDIFDLELDLEGLEDDDSDDDYWEWFCKIFYFINRLTLLKFKLSTSSINHFFFFFNSASISYFPKSFFCYLSSSSMLYLVYFFSSVSILYLSCSYISGYSSIWYYSYSFNAD